VALGQIVEALVWQIVFAPHKVKKVLSVHGVILCGIHPAGVGVTKQVNGPGRVKPAGWNPKRNAASGAKQFGVNHVGHYPLPRFVYIKYICDLEENPGHVCAVDGRMFTLFAPVLAVASLGPCLDIA